MNPYKLTLCTIAITYLIAGQALALLNPVGVYCKRMGYNFTVEEGPGGDDTYCTMPDGRKCLASDFTRGTCGSEYSYCVKKGYGLKITGAEAKCVLKDGTEEWVTDMVKNDDRMGGRYVEEKLKPPCGDGICEQGETPHNCPDDCPDEYEAAESTSSSSTATTPEETQPQATTTTLKPQPQPGTPTYVYIVAIAALLAIFYILQRRTKQTKTT